MKIIRRCVCLHISVYLTFIPLAAQETANAKLYLKTGLVVEGAIEEVSPEAVRFNQVLDDGSHLIQEVPIIIIYKLISQSGEEIIHNRDLMHDFEKNFARQHSAILTVRNEKLLLEAISEENSIKLNYAQKVEFESRKLVVSPMRKGEYPKSLYWKSFRGTYEITESEFFLISGDKEASESANKHSHSSRLSNVSLIMMSAGLLLYIYSVGKLISSAVTDDPETEEEFNRLAPIGALMTIGGTVTWLYSKLAKKSRWATYSYALETADSYNANLIDELLEQQTK